MSASRLGVRTDCRSQISGPRVVDMLYVTIEHRSVASLRLYLSLL